jgi:hypothetical protein
MVVPDVQSRRHVSPSQSFEFLAVGDGRRARTSVEQTKRIAKVAGDLCRLPVHLIERGRLLSSTIRWCTDDLTRAARGVTFELTATAADQTATATEGSGRLSLLGALITAASADLAVSMYQIGRGAAREAFGTTWQDAPVPFAVSKRAMAALSTFGVQRMHKGRPKAALILGTRRLRWNRCWSSGPRGCRRLASRTRLRRPFGVQRT